MGWRWFREVLFIFLLLVTTSSANVGMATVPNFEEKLKSAYLLNFAKFTRWSHLKRTGKSPDEDEAASAKPLTIDICVTDKGLYEGPLSNLVDRKVGKLNITVHWVEPTVDIAFCEILYVTSSSESAWYSQLSKYDAVLTVGETEQFLDRGGMIRFYLSNKKLRFSIHLDHINGKSFSIDGRMLRLAKRIGGES